MKLATLLLALLCAGPLVAQNISTKLFTLVFDSPVDAPTNLTYRAHASSSAGGAISAWTVVVTDWIRESTNNNMVVYASSNKVLATAPVQFFAVSASNEWGIVFWDVLATQPPPSTGAVRLR